MFVVDNYFDYDIILGFKYRNSKITIRKNIFTIIEQLQSGTSIETIGKGPVHDIIWLLRLPRLVLAAIVGAGLAVCGVIMQAIVKNPLADPIF